MSRLEAPLARQLDTLPPRPEDVTSDDLLDRFLRYVDERRLTLYREQEEAILEIFADRNVILGTPTGSGKSLVATALHFAAVARRERSFYTCPVKALVSEKFFALCRDFGPEYVGMMTGDASVNRDAPIICCTAEVLSNMALREGRDSKVDWVVMDEFHYYSDKERGVAWQIPLLTMPQAVFLLMSATLGPTEFFEKALTALNGRPTTAIKSGKRPVPLDFSYRDTPVHETVLDLLRSEKAPVYVVCFTQRAAAEEAQNFMSLDFLSKDEKKAIAAELVGVRFDSPYGKEVQKFVRHGLGLHHAGLLPKYRLLVEKLAQKGLLKLICGTDTLGVGVNIPIRTVLLTRLCKYDGEKTTILSVREFQQISGRAGRKGFDDKGSVAVQAPEHVIENQRLESRAGGDKGKLRRMVRKRPPEKGYVHWDKTTFDRLTSSSPEPLISRFQVTHGMLLHVLARPSGGCKAMARIVHRSHERRAVKRIHGRSAASMFRSLVDAGIIAVVPETQQVQVNADLQEEFSLDQALSLYLLDTIPKVGRESETYALDLLTLLEAILENPELVLMKQLDKIKREKMAELKAAGVEYDERIAELEKLEYPKPQKEFIYATFNDFALKHPWVGENIRPKSIAREMVETFQSFHDYVKDYGLERAEGLLLRYLSDVYKTMVKTVPTLAKTAEWDEIEVFFRAIVKSVDSSLVDEWESLRLPTVLGEAVPSAAASTDLVDDEKAFTVVVRNEVFSLVRALARRDYVGACGLVEAGDEVWTAVRFDEVLRPFFSEHGALRTDPQARVPRNTQIEREPERWRVEQSLLGDEGETGWILDVVVDIERSRQAGRPVFGLRRIGV
jgi:superfamily II RNA helicase